MCLSAVYDEAVTVHFSTANGTATAGSDYVDVTDAVVTFPKGQTSTTITIVVNGDKAKESDEWFALDLSNGARTQCCLTTRRSGGFWTTTLMGRESLDPTPRRGDARPRRGFLDGADS